MAEYFIDKNVANMTTEAKYSSSLDSQAIAGTKVSAEQEESGYVYVKTPDCYHGWISKLRLTDIWDTAAYNKVYVKSIFAEVYSQPDDNATLITRLVISTCLPITNDYSDKSFVEVILPNKQKGYVQKSCVESYEESPINEICLAEKWQQYRSAERDQYLKHLGEQIAKNAKLLMGTPYLWGGSTPFGIDCSGLSQLAYRLNGIQLLRNSYMQYDDKRFVKVETNKELDRADFRPGDILFFDTTRRPKLKIDHTGIACGDGTFVEASGHSRQGRVIISQCNDVFFKEGFMGAVRLSPSADINVTAANN